MAKGTLSINQYEFKKLGLKLDSDLLEKFFSIIGKDIKYNGTNKY